MFNNESYYPLQSFFTSAFWLCIIWEIPFMCIHQANHFPTAVNTKRNLSPAMRKHVFGCISENKGADQLLCNGTADQHFCFCHKDSTIPLFLNPKFLVTSHLLSGLNCTLSETQKMGLLWRGSHSDSTWNSVLAWIVHVLILLKSISLCTCVWNSCAHLKLL